ncbi:Gramicidin S synthase II [Legionella massiliensis]|uniref:Gramicidin S synthase II n=1 Tax=Legionella massiliensis TaxID=1034943 RepID=A0A078L2D1_9GAMM|nr:amino acid adenylation domain-containing protein [Legionella massiliensis]CDZ79377.1 Gramicidin S synthase II [Legionella massiliensis]CEE15115.1 Gramicidin S synthase 2 [Legionella massiliensis]
MNYSQSREIADTLINWLRDYAPTQIDSNLADAQGSFPPHVFMDLAREGFFGMHVSRQYGGLELKLFDMLRVIEQLGAIDLTLSTILIEVIQGAHTLENYASQSMKNQYLTKLAKGGLFTSGAMTEAEAGSNPRAMKSMAVPHQEGKWLLRGSKRWVGMANSAELIAIYVQQFDANNSWVGMSGFLVPRNTPGLHIGAASPTMGLRGFSKHTIYLEDIEVTPENLLGESGQGMEIAQDNMMYIRLCLAAASIGSMKRCIQLMSRFAERRRVVTGLLIDNPVTLVRLSEMTAIVEALDNVVFSTASFYDDEPDLVPEEAFVVAKILGSEYLGEITDQLVQLLGARGYEEGSGVSQYFRDARVFRIFEGPTEALNMYLGSRVLDMNSKLEHFISKLLNQEALFEEINRTISQVKAKCFRRNALGNKQFSKEYWCQALVGEVMTYGLLLAFTDYQFTKTNSSKLYRASLWARYKYYEIVNKALNTTLGERVLIQQSELHGIVSDYSQTIGNIEQVRQSQDVAIDDYLKIKDNHFALKEERSMVSHNPLTDIESYDDIAIAKIEHIDTVPLPNAYVHQLFESKAVQAPDAVALVNGDEQMSYHALNANANQVAHFLINKGFGANTMVGLYLERSSEMIIGLLGILKAGSAYLPLDSNYPGKSLQYMFENSGAEVVLTHRALENKLPFTAKNVFFIEDILGLASAEFDTNPQLNVDLDSLGYLIYTSGSTGKPKGVMLPNRALTNLMSWHFEQISEKRNVLQFTTLSFDMSFIEIFSALGSGGTLVLLSEEERLDPWKLSNLVKQHSIQQLVLPVSFLKVLTSTPIDRSHFNSLKEVIVAGEQLTINPAILSFFTNHTSCKLLNYYGPAETHVVTAFTFPEKTSDWPDYPPIGRPIFNTEILLLDESKQPVMPGESGEVYIRGVSLAKGYINQSELTKDKFILDPLSEEEGARLYKTGDMARFLPDGNLVFLGRKDEQLKVRGFRVEPQEIELELVKYPGVREAGVIARKGFDAVCHLEAFIVLEEDSDEKVVNLIYSFLQERLLPHMVPSVINLIDQMPLTDSGKIDRKKLEKYNKPIAYSLNKIEEPSTTTEKDMLEIMETIFKFPIGINHSFTSIGGNSLLAMHIVTMLKEKFAVELPAYTLLSDAKISETAKRIDGLLAQKDNPINSVCIIKPQNDSHCSQ